MGVISKEPRFFSCRTGWELEPNTLARALACRQASGRTVLDLTLSNPTRAEIIYPAALWHALAAASWKTYAPTPLGMPSARAAVQQYYAQRGQSVSADHIVLTASTSEAYGFLLKLLADPGDQVLVPRPSYPLFGYLGDLEGVRMISYPLRPVARGWQIDVDRLAACIGPRTRAVVLVSPNNPTGSYVTRIDYDAVERLALECGLALIMDEVFTDYPVDRTVSARTAYPERCPVLRFTLNGLSKSLGLPQVKLSWMVVDGPEAQRSRALALLEVIADTYLSVNTGVQQALPELLAFRAGIQRQISERINANLVRLRRALRGISQVRLLEPQGGWSAVLELAAAADEVALALLRQDGIRLFPGSFFDFDLDRYLVISLLSPQAGIWPVLAAGLKATAGRR